MLPESITGQSTDSMLQSPSYMNLYITQHGMLSAAETLSLRPTSDETRDQNGGVLNAEDELDVFFSEDPDDDGEVIVVVGRRLSNDSPTGGGGGSGGFAYISSGYLFTSGEQPIGPDSEPVPELTVINPPADDQVVEIKVMVENPTPEEQAAIKELQKAVENIGRAIKALADNAEVTLPGQQKVSGAELKAAWALTDFVVDKADKVYLSGSKDGEAAYNAGNPIVSFTITNVVGYYRLAGGLNYVVGHEIAHLTSLGRAFDSSIGFINGVDKDERAAREQMANDISRAIATSFGLPVLASPGDNYGTADPLIFQTPSGGGGQDDGGGSGGGTGGGGGGWVVPTPI